MTPRIVQVAVPVPLRRPFDYLAEHAIAAGTRVLVPFGRRRVVGIVTATLPASSRSQRQLKPVLEILEADPSLPPTWLKLLTWLAGYYHFPIGETIAAAIPVLARNQKPVSPPAGTPWYRAIAPAPGNQDMLTRSPTQRAIFQHLSTGHWVQGKTLSGISRGWKSAVSGLLGKGLLEQKWCFSTPEPASLPPPAVDLTCEQRAAAEHLIAGLSRFRVALLEGITGSGKTEVYLEVARHCIATNKQVLILVPEISLTPQLVSRVQAQLGQRVYPLHSGMTERARFDTWWLAREGLADVVLGTRSAVFTQMKRPGLVVVDEEHDLSYKQQEGLRYHARDFAIKRAMEEGVPVVLGSATPSMESLHNARSGRYDHLTLTRRAGAARLPTVNAVDLEVHPLINGLSAPIVDALRSCLDNGDQAIVYINRRGYAPLVKCFGCDWQAACEDCNAALTFHRRTNQFRCHHCGHRRPVELNCPECGTELFFAGAGTQRIEQAIQGKLPEARIARLDRDEANTASKLYRQLDAIRNREVDIVVGTQLITKGHDFAGVALVCVVNADQGLFSADFRAPELMFQQLVQVSGRAGRISADGEVLIQTRFADHDLIRMICRHDYQAFATRCLAQRQQAQYPPFGHFALFRAESESLSKSLKFLELLRNIGEKTKYSHNLDDIEILFPVPSPMEKLAGRYRCQLLIRSAGRPALRALLQRWVAQLETLTQARSVRWSLDVDPMDMS